MKLLLENWKKYLKEQEEPTGDSSAFYLNLLSKLPKGSLKLEPLSQGFKISYTDQAIVNGEKIEGRIELFSASPKDDGACYGAFKIHFTEVKQKGGGWGALLYELALEYASTVKKTGLMADRRSTQPEAVRIWKRYREQRKDVQQWFLDTKNNNFTPNKEDDNCNLSMLHWYVIDPQYQGRVYSVAGDPTAVAERAALNKLWRTTKNEEEKEKIKAKFDSLGNKFSLLVQQDINKAKQLANSNPFGIVFHKPNNQIMLAAEKEQKLLKA
jgi:hypothetical protein